MEDLQYMARLVHLIIPFLVHLIIPFLSCQQGWLMIYSLLI